jgi:hypothetical protein
MKKLSIFAGHAPKSVTLCVHLIQQFLKLSQVSFNRRRAAFHSISIGQRDVCDCPEEAHCSDGFKNLSTTKRPLRLHVTSSSLIKRYFNRLPNDAQLSPPGRESPALTFQDMEKIRAHPFLILRTVDYKYLE